MVLKLNRFSSVALASTLLVTAGAVQAATIEDFDLSQKPLNTPTLDYLHDNDVIDYEYNYDGEIIEGTDTKFEKSGYNLAEVINPSLDNVITKYIYDEASAILNEKHYQVSLRQTEYGSTPENASEVKYFTWANDSSGNKVFESATSKSGANDITYYVDNNPANVTDYVGQYIESASKAQGAVVYLSNGGGGGTYGDSGDLIGDFIGNYVKSTGDSAYGGAVSLEKIWHIGMNTSGNISGDFIGNHAEGLSYAWGGAISNSDWDGIGAVTGNFIGNYAKSSGGYASGGAIIYSLGDYDYSSNIVGDFIGNYAQGFEGADGGAITISNGYCSLAGNITGDFIGNYAKSTNSSASGGAISIGGGVWSVFGNITGDFIGNYAEGLSKASGGAIDFYGYQDDYYGDIRGNFIGNRVISNSGIAQGGAIHIDANSYDTGTKIGKQDADGNVIGGIINSSFINNSAISKDGTAQAGAIYTKLDMNIIAKDGYTSVISGNYVEDKDGIREEAIRVNGFETVTSLGSQPVNGTTSKEYIYQDMVGEPTILNLTMENGGKFILDDQIAGEVEYVEGLYYNTYDPVSYEQEKQYVEYNEEDGTYHDTEPPKTVIVGNSKLNITSDGTGFVQLNNDIIGFDVNIANTTMHLGARDNVLDGNNLILDTVSLSMLNNQAGVSALNSLTLAGDTNVLVDVDLENQTMDRFTANAYGDHQGKLNVIGMNLLSDAVSDKTEILFAEKGLKDNVVNGIAGELPNSNYQTTLFTPIYKYNVSYDNREDAGYFVFAGGPNSGSGGSVAPSTPSVESFNPAVLGSSTSATVGAIGTMNQTMNYAFQNADNYMHIPYLERIAYKNRNKYALSPTGDATDVGTFSPLFTKGKYGSAWVKPYATFENVGLKNGPKVSNITYGTLVGFDTELESIKNGWDRTFTGYIGYNGASQRYSGVDSYQNGGLLGGTMTLYKGNFFNATTLSVGASVANNSTMYGNDDYAMLLSGIGNKTGYNFEFKEGKVILQPSMLLSYTFVNTFDYTNAAGVRIDNDPLHAIQLAPGMKLIGNTKNGWQPYLSVSMVWNLMGKSDATANGVRLPQMSIKPYVQYGVGVQKRFKDHFMGFGQAMVQNGGRNGISLTAGFRWAIGHDKCKYEEQKVQKQNNTKLTSINGKTILKQLTPEQKMALGGVRQNTSRTVNSGVLKSL